MFRVFKETQEQNNKSKEMLNFLQLLLNGRNSFNTLDWFPSIHRIKADTVRCVVLRMKAEATPFFKYFVSLLLPHNLLPDIFLLCGLFGMGYFMASVSTYVLQFITLGLDYIYLYWHSGVM